MKPVDTGKRMEGESLKPGSSVYWVGNKRFMKKRVAKKRRRVDRRESSM